MPHAPTTTRSVWWHQEPPLPSHAPLEGRADADVVVVGAGIVGTTVASDLAVRGMDVVLLESGRVGSGATGHTSAKATALQSPRYAELEQRHGADAAAGYARLSLTAVERIAATDAVGDHVVRAPALTWAGDPDTAQDLRDEAGAARRAGLDVEVVASDAILPVVLGLVLRDQVRFDPLRHLATLLRRGIGAGLRVHESSPVTRVSLTGDRRRVRTGLGDIEAGTVVVATGLPILDRGAWFARMHPESSYSIVVEGGDPDAPLSLRTGDDVRSARPLRLRDGTDATLVTGAGHRVGSPPRDDPFDRLQRWASDHLGTGTRRAAWAAQDWHPVQSLPLAGPLVPGDDRVLAAGGFGKWGLTSGTAAASTLVRRIVGAPLTDVDHLLDPARRPRPADLRDAATANGKVGWHATSGWLRAVTGSARPGPGEGAVGRDGLRPVAVADVDGQLHRCSAVCPHLGGIVRFNPHTRTWACPLHGSRFDVDGRIEAGPATRGLATRGLANRGSGGGDR